MLVHLVRHGETASYDSDSGLTERGGLQAERRGRDLAAALHDTDRVRVLHTPTERARLTAERLVEGLRDAVRAAGQTLQVAPPVPDEGYANVRIWVDGVALEPTQARPRVRALATSPQPLGWVQEARRFWAAHEQEGDAMGFWLRTPMLFHESPAAVVTRLLAAAGRRAADPDERHLVVVTHSGCLRALVAWAAGCDRGEPDNAEDVVLEVNDGVANVYYRDEVLRASFPVPAPW